MSEPSTSKWHYHIGPETNTERKGLPYINLGTRASANWPKVHIWCNSNNIEYSWNGSRFNFTNLDDLLHFCDTWLRDDEFDVIDDGF